VSRKDYPFNFLNHNVLAHLAKMTLEAKDLPHLAVFVPGVAETEGMIDWV